MTNDLYWRYLLWAYKTTRESFERIERKTTQLVVDEMLQKLLKTAKVNLSPTSKEEYQRLVAEFDEYVAVKRADEVKLKYVSSDRKELQPQYVYLKNRLSAIEATVKKIFGAKELTKFRQLYSAEFTRRILEAKDHH